MWLRAEIVGKIKFVAFFVSFSISDIFIEFCSWKPHAEILLSFRRQPSELSFPKSLAIALIYVPAEHFIFISIIPLIWSQLINFSSSIFTSLGANSKFSFLKAFLYALSPLTCTLDTFGGICLIFPLKWSKYWSNWSKVILGQSFV